MQAAIANPALTAFGDEQDLDRQGVRGPGSASIFAACIGGQAATDIAALSTIECSHIGALSWICCSSAGIIFFACLAYNRPLAD